MCEFPLSIFYTSNSQTQTPKDKQKVKTSLLSNPNQKCLSLEVNPIPKDPKKTKDLMALSYFMAVSLGLAGLGCSSIRVLNSCPDLAVVAHGLTICIELLRLSRLVFKASEYIYIYIYIYRPKIL